VNFEGLFLGVIGLWIAIAVVYFVATWVRRHDANVIGRSYGRE
jgi:hypothetical protein